MFTVHCFVHCSLFDVRLQDHQNHPQEHQNRLQGLQSHPNKQPLVTVDVMYVASNKEETNPGASGQVQDHQEHHRDDQEQLLDNFLKVFTSV